MIFWSVIDRSQGLFWGENRGAFKIDEMKCEASSEHNSNNKWSIIRVAPKRYFPQFPAFYSRNYQKRHDCVRQITYTLSHFRTNYATILCLQMVHKIPIIRWDHFWFAQVVTKGKKVILMRKRQEFFMGREAHLSDGTMRQIFILSSDIEFN